MKNLVLLMLMFSFICPSASAMKAYSYDSNGNRVYQEVVSKYKTGMKTSSIRKYTSDYDPRAVYEMQGTTTFRYDSNGQMTGRIKRTGDGRTYVYDANGNCVKSYRTFSNKSLYNSRVSRTSYRVRPSGAFYR